MNRVTHCKNPQCRKKIDERTRFNSIQVFGFAVCSISCGLVVSNMEQEGVLNHGNK